MQRFPLLNESEAGTPQTSSDGMTLRRARILGHPTILPYPHVLGFLGQCGDVKLGTYVFVSPVYNAAPGRGFTGQTPLGPGATAE